MRDDARHGLRHLWFFALGFSVLACTRTGDAIVADGTPKNGPSASVTAPSPLPPPTQTTVTPPSPNPPTIAQSEKDAPALGANCTDPTLCGTKNRVAMRAYHGFDYPRKAADAPCTPNAVKKGGNMQKGFIDDASACVAGDRLFIDSACMICRTSNEIVVEALIAEMTPAQITYAQNLAHLDAAPAPTPAAWQTALAGISTRN